MYLCSHDAGHLLSTQLQNVSEVCSLVFYKRHRPPPLSVAVTEVPYSEGVDIPQPAEQLASRAAVVYSRLNRFQCEDSRQESNLWKHHSGMATLAECQWKAVGHLSKPV